VVVEESKNGQKSTPLTVAATQWNYLRL